jgi:DNA-binding protein H-NS
MATLENIQARIRKLQTQAETLIAERAQGALDQIRELMIKHGLTTEDIEQRAKARRERARAERLGLTKGASAAKGKLPPKYRDPKTGATWSGHARPPSWIKDVKDRTRFLIDPAQAASEPGVTAKTAAKKTAAKKTAAGKAAAKKAAGRKVAKKAVGAKSAAKKAAVKSAGKNTAARKTAAKKTAAKSATPMAGKRAAAKKAAAKKAGATKAPAKKAAARKVSAKKAPVKSVEAVVETPVTVQTPTPTTGEA